MLRRMAKDLGTGVDMGRRSEYPTILRAGIFSMIAVKGEKCSGKLQPAHLNFHDMLTKKELLPLIKKYSLLTIEVDSRHIEVINEVFRLGVNVGINQAKESVVWRINGDQWASFIDIGMTPNKFIDEDEKCQS